MTEVTRILTAIGQGDPKATDQLLPLVYSELRKLAAAKISREPANHSIQATVLVHEAYLKLVESTDLRWNGRGHFFGAAAQAMRRILVDQARQRKSLKGGGAYEKIGLSQIEPSKPAQNIDLIALDEALDELAKHDERAFKVVQLRFFAGLTIPQAAEALGVSDTTVENDWAYAKSWLKRQLK